MAVTAKFGGEFKIMLTKHKSKTTSIDKFAEQCTQDTMNMFSRSWSSGLNALIASSQSRGTENKTNSENKEEKRRKEKLEA